mgnify:CR=1 FL=1
MTRSRRSNLRFQGVEKNGRSEWIRTTGPCLPKTVLYQAELHSDRAGAGLIARVTRHIKRPLRKK